jgi:FecR protein
MRFPALICSFLLCCGLASGCWKGATRQIAATVLSVHGPVVFGADEQTDLRPVAPETRLPGGSSVRTLDGAWLNLALVPGALLQLSSNSEIKIEELNISKDGNETDGGMRGRVARLRLSRGKITALFSRSDKSASQFAIGARQATITVDSDCLFCVQSDQTTTRLTCVRGKVYVWHSGQPVAVAIGAGYFQKWPSVRLETTAAADNAAAQIDVADSLKIGDELRELQFGWQNRRPF